MGVVYVTYICLCYGPSTQELLLLRARLSRHMRTICLYSTTLGIVIHSAYWRRLACPTNNRFFRVWRICGLKEPTEIIFFHYFNWTCPSIFIAMNSKMICIGIVLAALLSSHHTHAQVVGNELSTNNAGKVSMHAHWIGTASFCSIASSDITNAHLHGSGMHFGTINDGTLACWADPPCHQPWEIWNRGKLAHCRLELWVKTSLVSVS